MSQKVVIQIMIVQKIWFVKNWPENVKIHAKEIPYFAQLTRNAKSVIENRFAFAGTALLLMMLENSFARKEKLNAEEMTNVHLILHVLMAIAKILVNSEIHAKPTSSAKF